MTYRWSQSPVVWCFLLGAAVFLWALRPIWDMDLWWHIALEQILKTDSDDPLAIGRSENPWSHSGRCASLRRLEPGLFTVLAMLLIGIGFGVLAGACSD